MTSVSKIVRLRADVAIPLVDNTLSLHSKAIAVPTYDRSSLTSGIVHVGVGGFHRAHQAVYFDDLASKGVSSSWGVTGVGLRSPEMKTALAAQDCLYSVVERSAEAERVRVIGSLIRCLYAPEESERVAAALADERTRVVTLTITGDGYCLRPGSSQFDEQSDAVRADVQSSGPFRTAWAYLAAALADRRRRGVPPFTVMSCDNVPDNGRAARTALVSFAALRDPALAAWIEANVAFPSSMVDRITPKTTPDDRNLLERTFGVLDRWPVITEPFSQWVIEDAFCNERPPLEEVGVEFVEDVAAHKLVKSRLLNGTHCALGYLGLLAGYGTAYEAMQNPLIHRYVYTLMSEEVAPLLPHVPGFDLDEYRAIVMRRLMNPRISDQLSRLAARGSTKMPMYLLPSISEARTRSQPHALLTLAAAAWLRHLRGYDFEGRRVEVQDVRAQQLTTLAKVAHNDPRPLLQMPGLFGPLGRDDDFARCLGDKLRDLDNLGVQGALHRALLGPEMISAVG
jgi:mannitol 2-dehydrogenase